jgi:hypothetical protein
LNKLLAELFVELLPVWSLVEQWPLASGHGVLHGSLQEIRETNFRSVTAAIAVYKSAAQSKATSSSKRAIAQRGS